MADLGEAATTRSHTTSGFPVRAFDPERDIPGVAQLLHACELVDWEGEETSEEDVRAQLSWPRHDPLQDRWVVESPHNADTLIGYALVWAKTPAYADLFVATHPSYRRRGIGGELQSIALERAATLGVQRVGAYASTMNAAASQFLYTHGFEAVSSYWDLLAPADISVPEPTLAGGYTIQTFDTSGNPDLLVNILNQAYGDLWGHGIASREEIDAWLPSVSTDHVGLLVAPDRSVVGICRFHREGGEQPSGYIDAPGIAPAHRNVERYLALTEFALHRLWRDARYPVRLESWGDDPNVIAAYQALGFSTLRHSIAFGHEIRPAERTLQTSLDASSTT